MTQTKDARHWLDSEIKRLTLNGQTWGTGRPFGDLLVPHDGLVLHEPLVLPKNCNLIGPRTHTFDVATFIAADGFSSPDPTHQWAISWEPSASQGNFSEQAHNVSIDCRNRCDGLKATGDQGSRYVSILVEHAAQTNVLFDTLTHGSTATNIWVKGAHEDDAIRGTGIAMRNCSGFTLLGSSIHRCTTGLVKRNCSTVHDIGTDFEKVIIPFDWLNAVNCDSSSHHMLHQSQDGDLGNFTSCELSVVKGTLRRCTSSQVSVGINMARKVVSTQGDKNDPKPFIFSL